MEPLINITKRERKKFHKHFLSSVHSEIRFAPIEITHIIANKEKLSSAFKERGFSEVRDIVRGAFTLEPKSEQPAKLSQQSSFVGVIFTSQNPRREVKIENDKVVYSDYNYIEFEEFNETYKSHFDLVSNILGLDANLNINKIGLKKINTLEIQPFTSFQDVLSIFNPALFSIARSGLLKYETFRVNEETTVAQEDDNKLFLLKTSLLKAQNNSLIATLDFDFVMTGKELKVGNVFSEILSDLNQCHFDMFMWSVTDVFLNIMETE